ncbi:hypothetical protein Rmf_04880 [Roseomonas fluvialis]|uniref:Uncharacterized protein n=1 Tax=Roseomonas fluvialis TaxID=1750527 RepID=A0ABN6NVT9_9PROT|nr:hypothetical protein Rmf_04880 [Roseomonas fluvialis]
MLQSCSAPERSNVKGWSQDIRMGRAAETSSVDPPSSMRCRLCAGMLMSQWSNPSRRAMAGVRRWSSGGEVVRFITSGPSDQAV